MKLVTVTTLAVCTASALLARLPRCGLATPSHGPRGADGLLREGPASACRPAPGRHDCSYCGSYPPPLRVFGRLIHATRIVCSFSLWWRMSAAKRANGGDFESITTPLYITGGTALACDVSQQKKKAHLGRARQKRPVCSGRSNIGLSEKVYVELS